MLKIDGMPIYLKGFCIASGSRHYAFPLFSPGKCLTPWSAGALNSLKGFFPKEKPSSFTGYKSKIFSHSVAHGKISWAPKKDENYSSLNKLTRMLEPSFQYYDKRTIGLKL